MVGYRPRWREYAPHATTVGIYTFYLVLIPSIMTRLVPCMALQFGQSYDYANCNLSRALDRFLLLALAGLAVGLFVLFSQFKSSGYRAIAFTGAVCASLSILSFHLFLPYAEGVMKRAPIILESLR